MTNETSPTTGEKWSSPEIVAEFLAFFRSHGHLELPGSPLGVSGSGTSFTVAGMQQFIPYLRGEEPPPATRITDLQRCLRTPDVDAVGTNGRKLTAFHMLGNWSLGEYGKREAIQYAHELLERFGLDWSRLVATTYTGDPMLGIPPDEETAATWREIGVPPERIVPLGSDDNLWTMGGPGPCGPCTEIFVDRGASLGCGRPECRPGCACERYLEIWNLVFIEYELRPGGKVTPLPLRSVDTGMGLERVAAVLQGVPTVYETDLFAPARRRLEELVPHQEGRAQPFDPYSGRESEVITQVVRARRVILDHTRSALFAMLEGVYPGRGGAASVVRRLIRRAALQGRALGIEGPFLGGLVGPLVLAHGDLLTRQQREGTGEIERAIADEEQRFERVLTVGLRLLERMTPDADGRISGAAIFELEAARGFPAELAGEVLGERGLAVDWPGYERAREEHRRVSSVSAERRFGRA